MSHGTLQPCVAAATAELMPSAAHWARSLSLTLLSDPLPDPRHCDTPLLLYVSPQGLKLQSTGPGAPGPVWVDFLSGKAGHRRHHGGGKGQLIARAVGLGRASRPPEILDATAGLGQDAFVLATLGCSVTMLERSPVMAALLQDGIDRTLSQSRETGDRELQVILERMTLRQEDAVAWLSQQAPDSQEVVYLDPMFPGRDKSSLVKKEMRLSRHVVGQDSDAPQLLQAALGVACHRVVVKRPRKAPVIEGPAPDLQLSGKSSRYDIYTFRALP
ncbi:MAG: class I SAM-dependent methyltransferase [Oleiphilaceae bacterium]|nr:class I SAM-dependent methyltransferase [Oleiphilaceae bacterium]